MPIRMSAICKQIYLKDNPNDEDLQKNAEESKYNYSSRHPAYKLIDSYGWNTFYINLSNEISTQKCLKAIRDKLYNTKYELCNYINDHFKTWNEYTILCRGMIIDPNKKIIIATPFPKFFNYDQYHKNVQKYICKQFNCNQTEKEIESEEKKNDSFKICTHGIYEKVDGSLGICFYCKYTKQWRITTRGHFNSPQAQWAMNFISDIKKNIDQTLIKGHTYLFEIIYKENQIGVYYGDFEGLVFLTAYNNNGYEYKYKYLKQIADKLKFKIVSCYTQKYDNIDDIISAQKLIDKNNEGFVLCLNNGFRIKFKGEEYLNMIKTKNYSGTKEMIKNVKTKIIMNGILDKSNILKKYEDEFHDEVGKIFDDIYGNLLKRTEECVYDLVITNNLSRNQLMVCQQTLNNNVKFIESARKVCNQNLWKSYMGRKTKKMVGKAVNRITNELVEEKKWRIFITKRKK